MRPSKRAPDELRPVTLERGVARYAEGSCLVSFGNTRGALHRLPRGARAAVAARHGKGWVTAEYAMLPRATHERTRREVTSGKPSGRTQEIQRLIGRSLRAVVNLPAIGERQIVVDCDVIQADGGTRTGVDHRRLGRLHDASPGCSRARSSRSTRCASPSPRSPAASARARPCSTSTMPEDSAAETDANFVITGSGGLVEVQGTAEGKPFSEDEFLLSAARQGGRGAARRAAEEGRVGGGPSSMVEPRPCTALDGEVVIATHNPGKLREMRELAGALRGRGGLGRRARPAGAGRDRAHVLRERRHQGPCGAQATGLPALADDSGLCVDALDGAPGLFSADWAGPSKDFGAAMARVERELAKRRDGRTGAGAHFVSALVIAWPDGHEELFEGRVFGARSGRRGRAGLRLRPPVPAGRLRPHLRRDGRPRRSTGSTGRAAAPQASRRSRTARGLSSTLQQACRSAPP